MTANTVLVCRIIKQLSIHYILILPAFLPYVLETWNFLFLVTNLVYCKCNTCM